MSKISRAKGRRGEQQLVLYLRNLGYKYAERILRQYQLAGLPDVQARKEATDPWITFESKLRRDAFKTIYKLYYEERDIFGRLCFVDPDTGVACAMSTKFEDLLFVRTAFGTFDKRHKYFKTLKRILKLNEQRQTADFLVIRDNNKPAIFIRYWI